ncbi:bacterio-opsin activator domain-containing protein [Halorientalis litorea]|uniref:bacterio-opsin activator domain-containing protein n=1 Tax=Halorientalis litorea TaxID=2931977 RepID=UPI001FF3C7AA|nr:bacterio-opsin activator domain-containing protein [Halorientalis litorea]
MVGGEAVADDGLTDWQYQQLRRATRTHREELVVRLGGEVGLRPAEMTRIRPAHVSTHSRDGRDHSLLTVLDESGAADRTAYLPPDVEHDFRQFVRAEGVDAEDRILPVTPRRVQMLVTEVAERAADRTGDGGLADASSRVLRRYFAHQTLTDEGVHPRVVQAVGGWDRLASLEPYFETPEPEDVVAAFADTSLSGSGPDAETATEAAPSADGDAGKPADDSRLDAVLDAVRDAGDALVRTSTADEAARTACAELVGDAYAVAVFCEHSGDDVRVVAGAGVADAAAVPLGTASAVTEARETGALRATRDVRDDPAFANWGDHAAEVGYRAGAAVPVAHGETTHGVLCVGAETADAFTDRERTLLATLGTRIGSAITAAQQRKTLLADTAVELELRSTDPASFFVAASAEHDCTFALEGVVPGEDRSLLYFVAVENVPPDSLLEWVNDHESVADARLVREYEDEALFEFVVVGPDPSKALVQRGATVREMVASSGQQRVVSEVPSDADIRALLDAITDAFPATELVTKRERERPVETAAAFRSSLRDGLTEKQSAVLQAAYHAGYFEWPRGSTAEELADAIGITSPTLHNHLRRAQQKLLSEFFEGEGGRRQESPWDR